MSDEPSGIATKNDVGTRSSSEFFWIEEAIEARGSKKRKKNKGTKIQATKMTQRKDRI